MGHPRGTERLLCGLWHYLAFHSCVADGNRDCLKNCTKPNLVARHLDGKNFIGKEF